MAQSSKTTSPWIYIGCGCGGLALVLLFLVVGAGMFGASLFKGYVEDLEDPARRNGRILTMLGAESLPEGYHGQMFFSIPWVLDMAILSDGEPADLKEDQNLDLGELGEHAFLYLAIRDMGDARSDTEALWRGEDVDTQVDLDFRSRRELGRGEFEVPPQSIRWVAHAGEFKGDHGREVEGIYTVLLIDCPERDELVRRAYFWSRRDLETIVEGDQPDLTGSPADPEHLHGFLGHFDFCR